MKTLCIVLLLSLSGFTGMAQATAEKLIASCCEGKEGRCTGSASCTACRNCSRCAHCGSGGSCGVCSSSGSPAYYETPKTKKQKTVRSSSRGTSGYYEARYLTVSADVNLRKGPGTKYEVLEKLLAGEQVLFLDQSGDWVFIKASDSGKMGYVHSRYLNY